MRGDGAGEDVDGDCPLPMRGALVMTMALISPSRRKVSPAEQLHRSPRLVQHRFRLETAALLPQSFLIIFPGQKTPYSRRWTSGASQVAREAGGAPRGVGRALHPRGWWVAPLWCFLRPIFFIYSKTDFRGVSGLLELCRTDH